MLASQPNLIMDQVQHLPTGEQFQLIKRVADLPGRANQPQHIEDQLAAMAADPDIQREIRQIEAEFAGTETDGLKRRVSYVGDHI